MSWQSQQKDLSVSFFSFFNHRGREEGAESADLYIISSVLSSSSPCHPRLWHPQVSGRKTQKGYTQKTLSIHVSWAAISRQTIQNAGFHMTRPAYSH